MQEIEIATTQKHELIDITEAIQEEIRKANIQTGLIFIFSLHTTSGILITENEEGLKEDWMQFFKKITSGIDYHHDHLDGNAPSHIFAGILGQGTLVPIRNGRLVLGTWQRIFLAELDGPRNRKIALQFIKN
ncbi:YjbQ family protein [bacterium]|nr:YjbQ family protein [bacterium]